MHYILQPFRVLWKVWFFIVFVVTLTLFYPVFNYLLAKPSRFPLCFRIMRRWAWWLLALSGIRMKVEQRGTLPDPPFIICANHGSYVDIITMYPVFSDYFVFMGKSEINSWPLFHIFFTKGMNIPVDRANPKGAHAALERSKEELGKGHCVVIFPEGTIPSSAPHMKPFKNGAFKLAMDAKVPIVPVTFPTNWRRLQAGAALKTMGSPGVSRAIIHPPVFPADYAESGVVQMKQDIFATINEPIQEAYGNQ